jgi:hypothetical protein
LTKEHPVTEFDDLPPGAPEDDLPPLPGPHYAGVRSLVDATLALPTDPELIPEPEGAAVVRRSADLFLENALAMCVPTTKDEADRIAGALAISKQLQDAERAEWEPIRKTAYDHWKAIVAKIEQNVGRLAKEADPHMRRILGIYHEAERKKEQARVDAERKRLEADRAAEAKRIADQARAAGQPEAVAKEAETFALQRPVAAVPTAPPARVLGMTPRTRYAITIESPQLVPHEWRTCVPNEKMIQAHVTANKGVCSIPGVRVETVTDMVRSGRK